MKFLRLLILLFIGTAIFSSCKTQQRAFGYIENYSDTTIKDEVKYSEHIIQKDDLLSIFVVSDAADGGITDAMYNMKNAGASEAADKAAQGYLVDNDGNIRFPRLGSIKALGLSKTQLSDIIQKRLDSVLTNPTVIVRLLNFRVTMLGEVARPGSISMPGERLTILEAVGLSGDISIYGKKEDIVVIREVDGKVEYGKVDLSTKSIFQSPYFYLRQNDVVLINANKNKARLNDQVFNQRMNIAFSIINTIALLYNIFR
jgi:polysaccharide export outer membrane protein